MRWSYDRHRAILSLNVPPKLNAIVKGDLYQESSQGYTAEYVKEDD